MSREVGGDGPRREFDSGVETFDSVCYSATNKGEGEGKDGGETNKQTNNNKMLIFTVRTEPVKKVIQTHTLNYQYYILIISDYQACDGHTHIITDNDFYCAQ